jgi:lipopolysaccharide/colanic/teichoic acid biosynthesis glycosyltransferase
VLGRQLPDFLEGRPEVHLFDPEHGVDALRAVEGPVQVTLHLPSATPDVIEAVLQLLDAGIGIQSPHKLARDRYRMTTLDGPVELPAVIGAFSRFLIRLLDVLVASLGCLLLAMILPFVGLATWLEDRGPVLYFQERVGRDGKTFKIAKLRTMSVSAEDHGPVWAVAGDDRITRVGAVLRRFRLDEVPQFVNVLKGDMALIGPRPERPEFVGLLREHIPHYDVRHSVRPGMTGWGTVNVGYGNTVKAKYLTHQYDMFHLLHRSLAFDIEIFARTARLLFTAPSSIDHKME